MAIVRRCRSRLLNRQPVLKLFWRFVCQGSSPGRGGTLTGEAAAVAWVQRRCAVSPARMSARTSQRAIAVRSELGRSWGMESGRSVTP